MASWNPSQSYFSGCRLPSKVSIGIACALCFSIFAIHHAWYWLPALYSYPVFSSRPEHCALHDKLDDQLSVVLWFRIYLLPFSTTVSIASCWPSSEQQLDICLVASIQKRLTWKNWWIRLHTTDESGFERRQNAPELIGKTCSQCLESQWGNKHLALIFTGRRSYISRQPPQKLLLQPSNIEGNTTLIPTEFPYPAE